MYSEISKLKQKLYFSLEVFESITLIIEESQKLISIKIIFPGMLRSTVYSNEVDNLVKERMFL